MYIYVYTESIFKTHNSSPTSTYNLPDDINWHIPDVENLYLVDILGVGAVASYAIDVKFVGFV